MSATLRNPLVLVEKEWKEDTPKQELIAYVKVSGSATEKKKVVNFIPIDDGSRGIEHLVGHTMKQFDRHATEAALGEKELFQEFMKCLDGPTLHMFELIVSDRFANDRAKTKANFEQAKKLLKNEVCGYNDMRDTQIFWMNHMMKKPMGMSPRDFYFRFKEIYDVSMALDGKFQQPNEHEKKTMLFDAFPAQFKEKFQESAKTIEGSTIEEIVNYFQILYDFEKRKAQMAHAAAHKCERDEDDEFHAPKKQRGRDRQRSKDEYGDKYNERKDSKWNEPCRLHPYSKYPHTWGQCRSNPDSENFQPVRYNSRQGDGRDRSNNGNGNRNGSGNSNGTANKPSSKFNREQQKSNDAFHCEEADGRRSKSRRRSSNVEAENYHVGDMEEQIVSSIFDDE